MRGPNVLWCLGVFGAAMQRVLSLAVAVLWLLQDSSTLRVCAALSFLHSAAFGLTQALSKRGDKRYKSRQERMAAQGGHTAMLTNFAGFGPLTELILFWQGRADESSLQASVMSYAWGVIPALFVLHLIALGHVQADCLQWDCAGWWTQISFGCVLLLSILVSAAKVNTQAT